MKTTRRSILHALGFGAASGALAKLAPPEPPTPLGDGETVSNTASAPTPPSRLAMGGEYATPEQEARFNRGQFEFMVSGPLSKHDFVTLADGGKSVRRGGFDSSEVLLGVVVDVSEDGRRAWVALDV